MALYLAAAGVGTIGLLDADTVSLSNLQRQVIHTTADIGRLKVESAAEKLRAINPHINVVTHPFMLDSDNAVAIMDNYDLVMDCTDNLPTRLLINDTCVATGKAMVFGAVSRSQDKCSATRPARHATAASSTRRPLPRKPTSLASSTES